MHDLITRDLLRSLQYGIVVLGLLDAFVYAHHKHRQGVENPGNFGDCMKGRIRFMTAITPAYAHAYQTTCLARHLPAVPHQNVRDAQTQSQISLSSQCSFLKHVKEAMIIVGGLFIQMVVLALLMVKLLLDGV